MRVPAPRVAAASHMTPSASRSLEDMEPRGRTRKHVCNKCNKSFTSGRDLGGHMSCHWRIINNRSFCRPFCHCCRRACVPAESK